MIIGPFSASYLMIWLDNNFGKQSDIFAVVTLIFATIQLFVVYVPNRIKAKKGESASRRASVE